MAGGVKRVRVVAELEGEETEVLETEFRETSAASALHHSSITDDPRL